jgi:hypothetical protein
MPRPGVTPQFALAISAKVIRPCILVSLQFKTEVLNLWTGNYELSWGGRTWNPVGTLMAISGISEDSEVNAKNVTISLSGIPSDLIGLALTEVQRGLSATVYLGLFEANGVTLVPDPVVAYVGRMDQPTINDAGDSCTISINLENALVDMNRSVWRRYTSDDQQLDHPGDLGCAFVASIQNYQAYFGSLPQSQNN